MGECVLGGEVGGAYLAVRFRNMKVKWLDWNKMYYVSRCSCI